MLTWRRSTASAPQSCSLFPFMSLRQATEALRELREGGLIAEREYGGLDPDYRNWYTLTETGNAVA